MRRSPRGGHRRGGPARSSRQSGAGPGLCSSHCPGKNAFRRGGANHGEMPPRERAGAEDHGGRLPGHSRRLGKARIRRAAPKDSRAPSSHRPGAAALWPHLMNKPSVHVVGAGPAGLAAAVRLAGGPREIVLHEAARQAGGRCRSFFDPALGLLIDNGNYLLLSGNPAARNYLAAIGSEGQLVGPREAEFAFVDLATKERWRLRPNAGRLPWWIFSPLRRVPGTGPFDYLGLLRLLAPGNDAPIGAVMRCDGLLYERLWRPFFLAALNTEPAEASSHLGAAVVRETLGRGGRACRPLVATHGLSAAFVAPALEYLVKRGAKIRFDDRLRRIEIAEGP